MGYKFTWQDLNQGHVKISSLRLGETAYTQFWAHLDAVGDMKDWGCTKEPGGTSDTPIRRTNELEAVPGAPGSDRCVVGKPEPDDSESLPDNVLPFRPRDMT